MAVTEAIEKAVESLVLEGIKDKIWMADAPQNEIDELIKNYDLEESIADSSAIYNRKLTKRRADFAIEFAGGVTRIQGDYPNPLFRPFAKGSLKYFFTESVNLTLSGSWNKFDTKNRKSYEYLTFDANTEIIFLPKDKLTPYVFGGLGFGTTKSTDYSHFKLQYGLGLEYLVSDNVGFKIFGEHNLTFSDDVDFAVAGKRDDYYYRFGAGLTYYFK